MRTINSVLVVEDFLPFRRLISTLLQERLNFQVVSEASDGLEAVRCAKELNPDLIVMDIGLPGINGMEAARRMQKLAPRSKIVFLTQEGSAEVVEEALNLGALGYVQKDRTVNDLFPALAAALEGKTFVSRELAAVI